MARRASLPVLWICYGLLGMFLALLAMKTPSPGADEVLPKPGKKDRCPVCGMFPAKYPQWSAGFVLRNGARYFHCSPKCMLHNLHNIPKYQPGESRKNLAGIWVTEYYTTRRMDAHEVWFVAGTDLSGPMGLDLIPIKGREAAENLRRDYHGESILALDEITADIVEKARAGRRKP